MVAEEVRSHRHHQPCEKREKHREDLTQHRAEGRAVEDRGMVVLLGPVVWQWMKGFLIVEQEEEEAAA